MLKVKTTRKNIKNTVSSDGTVGCWVQDCVALSDPPVPHFGFSPPHLPLIPDLLGKPILHRLLLVFCRSSPAVPAPGLAHSFSSPPKVSCSGHLHASPGSSGRLMTCGETLGPVGVGSWWINNSPFFLSNEWYKQCISA